MQIKNIDQPQDIPEYMKKRAKTDKKEMQRLMDLYVDGINARAKVISIERIGFYAGRTYCRITLEVKPKHAVKFQIMGFAPVSNSLIPKAGDKIDIKYDPEDNSKFVLI